jgi:hypothetical protein
MTLPRTRAALAAPLLLSAALLAALTGAGCKMTPEEIRVIQAENELLREQIQATREQCGQTRELKLRREEEPPAQEK